MRVDGVKKHEPAPGLNAAGVNADVANTAVAKTSVRIIVPSQTRGSRGGRLDVLVTHDSGSLNLAVGSRKQFSFPAN